MHQTQPIGFPNPIVFDQITVTPTPTAQGIHYYRMEGGVLLYQSPTLSPVTVVVTVAGVHEWQINGLRMWHITTPTEAAEVIDDDTGALAAQMQMAAFREEEQEIIEIVTTLVVSGILERMRR